MAFVQSLGRLNLVQPTWQPGIYRTSVRMYDQYSRDYATLYRTQPNVRTCVDFLSRNIAQLGLHVFRRVSDTDRQRLTDHPLAEIIKNPLPARYKMTEYRFKEAIMGDLGIYFNAYLLKIRQDSQLGLLRIPPIYVTPIGNLTPSYYEITVGGLYKQIPPDDMVHFWGYNPENAISGLSPSETLRRILAEEYSAGQWREGFWQNSARMEGIIERPPTAPEWSEDAQERFKAEFAQLYSGQYNSGKTAVLEDGMVWKQTTFNARESEYLGTRKLTREECARSYHIPLPLVGILDNATFSNITEQHKHLYQDTLGPWLASIEQDIELQLLPEFDDVENVYVEFNIAEKLQGSFEEQTKSFQSAVGRPYMTPNEARAKLNLPSLGGDADLLATPLNVIVGGQASPQDSVSPEKGQKARQGFNSHEPQMRARYQQKWIEVLSNHYRRQEAAIIGHIPKSAKGDIGGIWWDDERWNRELQEDLLKLNLLTARAWADRLAEAYDSEVSDEAMMDYLQEHSRIQSELINNHTRDNVSAVLQDPEPRQAVRDVFKEAATVWTAREAVTAVTAMSSFGTHEGARGARLRSKTWLINSAKPRDSHAAINGETVAIGENFSNGLRWPGDSSAGNADEVAGCQCSVLFA